MEVHDLWHMAVLGSTLFAAAGLAIAVLAPLLFDQVPSGLSQARPAILAVGTVAVILIAVEWLGVH
jgi:hypothetical protein